MSNGSVIARMGDLTEASRQRNASQLDDQIGDLGVSLEELLETSSLSRVQKSQVIASITEAIGEISEGRADSFIQALSARASSNRAQPVSAAQPASSTPAATQEVTALRTKMDQDEKIVRKFVTDHGGRNMTVPDGSNPEGQYDVAASLNSVTTKFEEKLAAATKPAPPEDMVAKADIRQDVQAIINIADAPKENGGFRKVQTLHGPMAALPDKKQEEMADRIIELSKKVGITPPDAS